MMVIAHHHSLAWGWIGVDLFFVLSGFLISGLLFAELKDSGEISMGRFLVRRGFKIYPAFYVYVALTAALVYGLRPHWVQEAFFLQNYSFLHPIPTPGTQLWLHTWSLAVEEHFYVGLPLLLILLHRLRALRWVPALSITAILFCFVARTSYIHSTAHSVFVYPTHLRFDALFAGVGIGYFYYFKRRVFDQASRWYLLPLGIILLLPAISLPMSFAYAKAGATSATLTGTLLGFSAIVMWGVNRRIPFSKHLATIGTYSYSIYL